MSSTKPATHKVGSHVALMQFLGAEVPVGFLGSKRKRKCRVCSEDGFLHRIDGIHLLCACASKGAAKALQALGIVAFEAQAAVWLEAAMAAVQEVEARCHEQGYKPGYATNPYPAGSDQNLAWARGRARREELARTTLVGHEISDDEAGDADSGD